MDVIKSYVAPLCGSLGRPCFPAASMLPHAAVILSHGRFLIFLRVGCPSSSSGPSPSQSSLVDLLTQGREKQAASYLLRACCAPGHKLVLERPQVLTSGEQSSAGRGAVCLGLIVFLHGGWESPIAALAVSCKPVQSR